jgi:hypothetical protein
MPQIGILAPEPSDGPDASRATLNALVAGLRELGYTEGDNISSLSAGLENQTRIASAKSLLNCLNASLISLSR